MSNDIETGALMTIGNLMEHDREKRVVAFNDTATPYPADRTIIDLFENQVICSPNAEAIRFSDQSLTYFELNERANQVADHLLSLGTRPEDLIALRMDHSVEVICAILGILKSGAAYVPIDPSNPIKRVEYILQQIKESNKGNTPLLVTDKRRTDELRGVSAHVVTLNPDVAGLELCNRSNPNRLAAPGHLAYVIFTSGSTGEPKGVMIEHRSLVNYIWWARKSYVSGEGLAWPLFSSLAFDLTVTSIFTPLISGGRIVVYHDDTWSHGTLLLKVVEDRAVSVMKLTPAHLTMIKDMDLRSMGLQVLIVGGEDFKTDLAHAITRQVGRSISIYNEYGPTEATVGCMIHCFDPNKDNALSVPIGIPAANTNIFVLDDDFNPVPPNVVGQLFLAGDGLARGYLNRPDLTKQRFINIPDPRQLRDRQPDHSVEPRMLRVYQTGDLARWTEDGRLSFLGRSDHQVKIGGARIELGEIEARLQQHPDVRECVVTVVQPAGRASESDEMPSDRLAAYYVSEQSLTAQGLRTYLANSLPEYMIPSYFIQMAKLPLTTNGKFDRAALPAPDSDRPDVSATYVEQQSETEARVAGIWEEALKLSRVGIHDDFFELGGKSLPAIRILNQIKRTFGIDVSVSTFFTNPTIAQLSELIDRQSNRKG